MSLLWSKSRSAHSKKFAMPFITSRTLTRSMGPNSRVSEYSSACPAHSGTRTSLDRPVQILRCKMTPPPLPHSMGRCCRQLRFAETASKAPAAYVSLGRTNPDPLTVVLNDPLKSYLDVVPIAVEDRIHQVVRIARLAEEILHQHITSEFIALAPVSKQRSKPPPEREPQHFCNGAIDVWQALDRCRPLLTWLVGTALPRRLRPDHQGRFSRCGLRAVISHFLPQYS